MNNFHKNTLGQLSGAKRVGLVPRRAEREEQLAAWLDKNGKSELKQALADLDAVSAEQMQMNKQNFWYNNLGRAQLLSSAQTLYRNAIEREKPDAERERGYQERDQIRLKESAERIERRFDAVVDQAV